MTYWKCPKFWLALLIAEVAAFVASALISIGAYAAIRAGGASHDVAGLLIDPIGLCVNIVLGCIAFIWTRWDYRQRSEPAGFPVIDKQSR